MFYLLQANKIKKSKTHTLTMIAEGEKKDINRRAHNNTLSNISLEEYTGNPSESTNLTLEMDNMTFRVKNGTIKEVAYLFLYLGFSVQSINTTDKKYAPDQITKLITAITKKLANQQAVSQLQQLEEKTTPQKKEPSTTVVKKEPTPLPAEKKQEKKESEIKKSVQETNEENFLDIAQHALPDIDTILLASKGNKLYHDELETLQEMREKIHTAIDSANNKGLGEKISQAMVLMETIELGILQAEAETESTDVAQSLQADIVGVKDYKEGQEPKAALIKEETVTTIKKHISSGNSLVSNIQRLLQRVVLFTVLEVGGVSAYNMINTGAPFFSSIEYRPHIIVIAIATILWSVTRKTSIGVKIGSLILLIILSVLALRRVATDPAILTTFFQK